LRGGSLVGGEEWGEGEEEEVGKKGGAVEIGLFFGGGEIVEGLRASDFCDSRENMERHKERYTA